jgi:ABC-type transport system involved in multi-copper enzyme maturation permease subunit
MTFLPIAERELRVTARSRRTYWSRALAALVVILLTVIILDSYARFGRSRAGGQQVFSALAYLALAYSLFAGAALTADCISSEKREETLGFLFLTDLRGYDVVLGKLAATSLRSVYGLLATFPILSLPLLLGGVRASEFWRVILAILNTLLLSLAMGLLVSTLFRRQRVTTHLASLLMLLLALVPFAISLVAHAAAGTPVLVVDPGLLSPIYTVQSAFDSAYTMTAMAGSGYWLALLIQFIMGVLLLMRTSWLLPDSWQQSATATASAVSPQENLASREDKARRDQALEVNPFYWLASRGSGITVGLSLLVVAVGAWGLRVRDDRESFAAVQGVGILLVALVSRLLIAVAAAQRLSEDKQSGALDLIITTPMTVEDLLEGQWLAVVKKLRWPFLGSLVLYAFLIFGGDSSRASTRSEELAVWFTAAAFYILTAVDSVAIGWLGIWSGLRYRQVPHAAALCLLKVVVPPALVPAAFVWNHGITSADEYLKTIHFGSRASG